MSVFSANAQGAAHPREESVIALNSAVDLELRKERVGAVVHEAAEAKFIGQTFRSTMLERTTKRQPLDLVALGIFPGRKAHSANHFRLIGSSRCQQSLSVEKADPILRSAVCQISMNIDSGSAESSSGIRVEHGNDGAVIKLDRGIGCSNFHRERHFVLASHDLEGAPRLEIHVSVADGKRGSRLEQECVVELFSVVALHTEARPRDGKGVRRRAVAVVESVLPIQVSDGHKREVAIGALQEKVLTVPTGGDRRGSVSLVLQCANFRRQSFDFRHGSGSGRRDVGSGVRDCVDQSEVWSAALGLRARLDEPPHLRLQLRDLMTQLVDFFLGGARTPRGAHGG